MKPIAISCDGLLKVYFIEHSINDFFFCRFYKEKMKQVIVSYEYSERLNESVAYLKIGSLKYYLDEIVILR